MLFHKCDILCDRCGRKESFAGGVASSEEVARFQSWIITRDKKHFCDSECYKEFKNKMIRNFIPLAGS